jgi:hypothetical protein
MAERLAASPGVNSPNATAAAMELVASTMSAAFSIRRSANGPEDHSPLPPIDDEW